MANSTFLVDLSCPVSNTDQTLMSSGEYPDVVVEDFRVTNTIRYEQMHCLNIPIESTFNEDKVGKLEVGLENCFNGSVITHHYYRRTSVEGKDILFGSKNFQEVPSMTSLPQILIIQFGRYSSVKTKLKLLHRCEYPLEFD